MTHLPAPIDPPEFLRDGEIERQLFVLEEARRYVQSTADGFEANRTRQQARLAREWVKIKAGAEQVALAACRLELTALRRLGECVLLSELSELGLKKHEASLAKKLAALSDAEWTAFIVGIDRVANPGALWADWQRIQEGRQIGRGRPLIWRAKEWKEDPFLQNLKVAAATVVRSIALNAGDNGVGTTTAASALGAELGVAPGDPLVIRGLQSVVQESFREAIDPEDERVPAFVTYYEPDLGWVHIPWRAASLKQLYFMVQLRQRQRDEVQASYERLAGLVKVLESVRRRGQPEHAVKLADLYLAAKQRGLL